MTLSGVFDRIEAAATQDELYVVADELYQLAAVQGWPPQTVQLLREAMTLRRRRLESRRLDAIREESLDPTAKPPMDEILRHQIEAVQSVAELDQVVWAAGALTTVTPEAKQALRAQIVAKRQALLAGA
jgi:hypothetical protein